MIAGTIQQFWSDVLWGKLDVLLVDLPPGTADAALSVVQNLPLSGVILVTSPQQLAALVVRKAVNMLKQLQIPILGVVENFSYYVCPDGGAKHAIFGASHVQEIADSAGIEVLAHLPIDSLVTEMGDCGRIEEVKLVEIESLAARILQVEPVKNM